MVLSALKRQLPQTILIVVSHRTGVAAIADQCLHISNNLVTTVAGKADLQHTVPWFGSSDHFKS